MTAAALASALRATVVGDTALEIRGVQHDSRRVSPGDAFVAITGERVDGVRFVPTALEAGAVAVVSETPRTELDLDGDVAWLQVRDARTALGDAAHLIYGQPTHRLRVVGITGTNGKTTTSWLIDEMLRGLGEQPALLGTVGRRAGSASMQPASFTTPEADDLARFAAASLQGGASHLIMEVSSHGLALQRVHGARFSVAAFTNLSQDHLDFHGSMSAYGEAKAKLMLEHEVSAAVINTDDAFGSQLADRVGEARSDLRVIRCGHHADCDVRVVRSRFDRRGIAAELELLGAALELRSPLIGHHNLENLLVALGCGLALGHEAVPMRDALASAVGAPGRLQRAVDQQGYTVVVDYAHTPDALANALRACRQITAGRLIVVFGCGGDRDQDKRPKMGHAAAVGADMGVVTSDNPRTEQPEAIIDAIVPGVRSAGASMVQELSERGFVRQADRRMAIEIALRAARSGDTVLIAGKGHEDYQIIGTEKRPFDDCVVAREIAGRLANGEQP